MNVSEAEINSKFSTIEIFIIFLKMSVEEVGEVYYSAVNVINWTIPSFSLLSLTKDTRIWSPLFENDIDRVNLTAHKGFIRLNVHSNDNKETPVKWVRFGIAGTKNSDISCCDGEWEERIFRAGYFRVRNLVRTLILYRN